MEINDNMPVYCVKRIEEMLGRRFGKPLKGSRILILGVAYKPDIDDCRESPAPRIIDSLRAKGADIIFSIRMSPVSFITAVLTGREESYGRAYGKC